MRYRFISIRRSVRTVLQYLMASPLTSDPYERDQLFQTILDRRAAILIAPISTIALAAMVIYHTSASWPVLWAAAELLLTALRWKVMVEANVASQEKRRESANKLLVFGALWSLLLGIAIYLCMASGIVPLIVVSAIIGTAAACVVSSRNAATPRHALLLLILIAAPFAAGLAGSPIPGMTVAAMLIIPWIASLYLFIEQNHASMLRMIKAERRAHTMAITDELTGLFNRMHFAERRAKLDSRAPPKAGYCFLSLDLDGFKEVNDQYGHPAGDFLLRAASHRMLDSVRLGDAIFRMGGDEFLFLLPKANDEDCARIASRLIETMTAPFTLPNGETVTIGASIGSACIDGTLTEAMAVLHAADAALYRAKAGGKGQHVHAAA